MRVVWRQIPAAPLLIQKGASTFQLLSGDVRKTFLREFKLVLADFVISLSRNYLIEKNCNYLKVCAPR